MSYSIHQASVPVFTRALGNLSTILTKAEAYAEARKIDPATLFGARLALDMLPLSGQIRIACDTAKRGVSRLANVEPPAHPDTETSFAEFQARIASTIAYLESLTPAQIEGAEARTITMQLPGRELNFDGASFLGGFSLPNFFFHVSAAYMILRHYGLEIGKMDFLGGL